MAMAVQSPTRTGHTSSCTAMAGRGMATAIASARLPMRPRVRTERRTDKEAIYLPRLLRSEPLHSSHVSPDGLRQDHGSVRLLTILEDGDHRPPDREAAAVERRDQPGLLARGGPETDLGAAGLEVAE